MNWSSWLLWGFVSTVVLTSILAGSQGFGMTRMNIPYLLGTIFTPSRDKAKFIGFFLHFINGWVFSLIYVAGFQVLQISTWWFGAAIGFVHGVFVLTMALPVLPALHPRMANEQYGPTVVRQLEPRLPRFALRHSHSPNSFGRAHHLWHYSGSLLRGEMITVG